MKRYYIINPSADIHSLCASCLDESYFHSALTVVDSDGDKKVYAAWQVTLEQLQEIYRSTREKGISLTHFRVAVWRTRFKESARIAQKEEYIKGYQSQNKRLERLKEIQAKRREKFRE
jgi:hypothetical protein